MALLGKGRDSGCSLGVTARDVRDDAAGEAGCGRLEVERVRDEELEGLRCEYPYRSNKETRN